jgi:hypothetical protein
MRLCSRSQEPTEVWSLGDNTSITGHTVFGIGRFCRRWYEESSLFPSSSEFEREDEDEGPEVEGVDDESLVVWLLRMEPDILEDELETESLLFRCCSKTPKPKSCIFILPS